MTVTATTDSATERALASSARLAQERAPELNVADLADHAGYSPFHFSRLFARHVGIGPGQYLTALRVGRAKQLLLTETASVIDVAAEVGFDSLSSFSQRFRSAVGVPPAQLRRLADRISDKPPRPFSLLAPGAGSVRVTIELAADFSPRGDAAVWVGWYPHPAPIGLPLSGVLVSGVQEISLPLCAQAPFLLGFAVPAHADPLAQLVPADPVVAVHPAPLTASQDITLRFDVSHTEPPVPLLTALPSLCTR